MSAWLFYAVVAAALLALGATGMSLVVDQDAATGLWVAAAVAFVVQLMAFGALVAGRRSGKEFMLGWGAGMALRFASVAAVAFWVLRSSTLSPEVTLLALVGFMFVLVLLEPLFLKLVR